MKEQNINQHPIPAPAEDEIDLIAIAKTIWKGRKTIIKITLLFFAIGLFIAIFSPKQYSTTTVMVPQVTEGTNKMGGLSSLAAMAGFNLDMNKGSQLSPNIYPQIVKSIPFQKELMNTKINIQGMKNKISLYDYYTDPKYSRSNFFNLIRKFTIGLPKTIIKSLILRKQNTIVSNDDSNNSIIQLSVLEKSFIKVLSSSVNLSINQKEGTIILTTIMPEALASAQLGQSAQLLLQKYITSFKIEKAQAQLNFVEMLCFEKKEMFENTQQALAQFRDQNKNVSTALARTEEEKLQSDYQIAQSVYNELAKQVENSRIQVKEETPVFLIIEPISIPTQSFKPKRKQIVLIWGFIGGLIGIFGVFGKHYLAEFRKRWNEV